MIDSSSIADRQRRMIPLMLKVFAVVGFVLSAASASAQTFFIEGRTGADVRRFSAETSPSPFDGTARAGVIGAGGHILPHWTVGAELDLGARSTDTTTTPVSVSGRSRDIHNAYTIERRSASALVGYQTSAHHRVRMGYYAGLSFSVVRREIASDAEAIVLQTPAPTAVYSDRLVNAIVGVDAAVRVAPRLDFVAALRAQGLTLGSALGGHSVRPSIGARVTF